MSNYGYIGSKPTTSFRSRNGVFSIKDVHELQTTDDVRTTSSKVWNTGTHKIDFLVIAGGGGGSSNYPFGGGGAGGYRCSVQGEKSGGDTTAEPPLNIALGTNYTVTVGTGGAAETFGEESVFGNIEATGGGSSYNPGGNGQVNEIVYSPGTYVTDGISPAPWGNLSGSNPDNKLGGQGFTGYSAGGSGGGSGTPSASNEWFLGPGNTYEQGFWGGFRGGQPGATAGNTGGGGGGAGATGTDAANASPNVSTPYTGGDGGNGLASSITGSPVARAGGGGGGTNSNGTPGSGGTGGGGDGKTSSTTGQAGTVNTGSGGGGTNGTGGAGGSGVVILRYPNTITITYGGSLVSAGEVDDGDEHYIIFTSGSDNVSWAAV